MSKIPDFFKWFIVLTFFFYFYFLRRSLHVRQIYTWQNKSFAGYYLVNHYKDYLDRLSWGREWGCVTYRSRHSDCPPFNKYNRGDNPSAAPCTSKLGIFFWPLTLRMLIYNHFQKIRASGETFKKITAFIVVKIAKGEHFLKVLFLKA